MFVDNLKDELVRYRGKICQIALYPLDGENVPSKWIPFIEKLDGMICLTEWGKKETQRCVNVPVEVVPLGVDTELFYPINKEEKAKLRRDKFQFMGNKFVITWIGRNFSRKNPGLAIMGLAQWIKKSKAKDVLLYMHCSDKDPAGSSILEIVNRDYPWIADIVALPENHDIGRGSPRPLLAELIQASDIGLNTSLGEGWGMPLTETMACGLPMIAPAHSACMEQIGSNEERGELIEIAADFHASNHIVQHIGDPKSLANKLDLMYRNKNRYDKKAKAGYEWARTMTWENSSNKLCSAINKFYKQFSEEIPRPLLEVV